MYVAILSSNKVMGAANCSRLCASVDRILSTDQLVCLVIMPKHDLFVMLVALKYTQSWDCSVLLFLFFKEHCLMVSSNNSFVISFAEFVVCTELRPGVCLEAVLGDLWGGR